MGSVTEGTTATRMQLLATNYWNILINILLQKYFANLITTCILWSEDFDFNLVDSQGSGVVWLHINPFKLNGSFENNIYNFTKREETDNGNNVFYNQLIKKFIAAIEQAHCEGFVAFQENIPFFARAFEKASIYSIWRSMNNRFLFAYSTDLKGEDYFGEYLFKNQYNILVIEANFRNSTTFHLKTNKFVGSKSDHPQELLQLSKYYALNQTFEPDIDLFSAIGKKLLNLQGREIVVGAFDYRPFVAVDFQRLPLYHDQADDNPSHLVHVDGTDIRTCHKFCELYNCKIHFDTSEKEEWGLAFNNFSGYGMIGLITENKIEMAFGGIYELHGYYAVIDTTVYLGRSGVTCLVPAAVAGTSWDLPLRPFASTLWLAVLACLCLETIVLFVSRKFEQTIVVEVEPTANWKSYLEFGFAVTLQLFLNQSSGYLVNSHTVRTFLFACYMFDIILTSVYGGGLSAILTLPNFGEAADSVERLVKYNLPWSGSSYAWLESINVTDNEEETIYRKLINNFELNSREDMRRKAQTHNMGFIVERLAFGHFGGGDFFTPQALQRLKLMVDDIYSQFTVAMVPRLWPHLEKYNQLLLRLHSSGLDKFWEWKITAEYLNVNEQNQVEASKYNILDRGPTKWNIQNFAGLIVLWLAGVFLSVVAFILEIIWFKWSSSAVGRQG